MTLDVDESRLPASIGGLVDVALAAYAERAGLYIALALAAFAVQAIVEFALPAWKLDSQAGEIKLEVLQYAGLGVDALVVAAVALGVGTRVAGQTAAPRALLRAAGSRWLPVAFANLVWLLVVMITAPYGGFGPRLDPPAIAFVTAPICWLLWGAFSLALPIAALSPERPALAGVQAVVRALSLSFRRQNLGRLCLVAFASIVPNLIQAILMDQLLRNTIPRAIFWSNVPVDALTVGPLAALQTVFALDFARRAGVLRAPPR